MPRGRYLIVKPIIAVFEEDGQRIVHTVPAGAFVTTDLKTLEDGKLTIVSWHGKMMMIFVQDLRTRPPESQSLPGVAVRGPVSVTLIGYKHGR